MRAFALEEFGEPGSVREIPDPELGEGQVLVSIRASSLNPMDSKVGNGDFRDWMEHRFPLVLGLDFAGVVEELGPGVNDLQLGQAVFGAAGKPFMGNGTLAERATVSASTTAPKPASIGDTIAAAIPTAGCAALTALEAVGLAEGDDLLVVGAAGGVGSFAVQLAARQGARVIGVAQASNAGYLRELGVAEVVDYTREDVTEAVRRLAPDGLAGIIDLVSDADTLTRLFELVRDGGTVVSALHAAPADGSAPRGIKAVNLVGMASRERLEMLGSAIERGELKPPEIKRMTLHQAAEGLKELASGHVRGKLVVTI